MAALPFFILPCRALCPAGMPAPAAVRGGAVAVVADTVGEPPVGRSVTLGEVVVGGSTGATGVQMRSALNTVGADSRYIEDNFGGSLMQSLSGLPGVRAMSIGSGSSKPMIRGLGFNRVVVAENGAEACLGWQANSRRERSEPVSHGYMPKPPGTLERSFDKHTLTATATVRQQVGMCAVRAGAAIERQVNRRGGWGFILPDFEQLGFGAFVAGRLVLGSDLILSAGVRFDCGSVGIHSYRDWYKTPVDGADSVFMERSAGLNRWFSAVTWSVGVNRRLGRLVLKANAGKGFRMPIAKELGTDGVNYSIFRYERGNASLAPEVSYQADAGVVYAHRGVEASLTPYVNYFPNYICLNPTPEYLEGLQLYRYTQGRVLRWGGEASLSWRLVDWLELGAGGEYLWARQLSGDKKGYTLPFSAPWRVSCGLRFMWGGGRRAGGGHASAEFVAVGAQRRVVPPEEPTAGHCLVNVAVGQAVAVAGHSLHITLRCDNLLGSRYYDHTSYYRLIGVPEPGRSFALMASWAL